MKFKVTTLIAILLIFILAPVIYSFTERVTIATTIAVSVQEEEENHKQFDFDVPDYLIHYYKNPLFIFQNKQKKLTTRYSFSYYCDFIKNPDLPPESLQYLS